MSTYSNPQVLSVFCLLLVSGSAAPQGGRATFPPPMDVLYENRVQAECDRWLSVNLFNVAVDHQRVSTLRFRIVSLDDPNYAARRNVRPRRVSIRTRAIRVARRKQLLVKGTHVFLELPQPMVRGRAYGVRMRDLGRDTPELAPVVFDDRRTVNDNIRVSQLGYVPGFAKRAYLGQFMGDAGGMPFRVEQFHLLDEGGQVVFTGSIARRAVGERLVGQEVHELDFTAFEKEGTYRLFVPGVGLSYAFDVSPRALNPAYVNLMRGNYHQRCGAAVDRAFSRHPRPACHLDDAWLEKSAEKLSFVKPKNPLYPTHYDGQCHRAVGGHHDAGDYGKYTITGAAYVFSVLLACEVHPERFVGDNLSLPYSGNSVPDLLEECQWELQWLEQMQDERDGAVFGVIKPRTGGYENGMPPSKSKRLFYPKDTVFTAAYAAALARAGRSAILRQRYPDDCRRYLQKARRAWDWLERNETFVHYFHYGGVFGDWDERCWAAAELYASTGESRYHKYFLKHFDPGKKHWGWWGMYQAVGHAVHTYVSMSGRERSNPMLRRCRKALVEACDAYVADAAANPYRLSMPKASVQHGRYGWYFPGDMFGFDLLMGYALTKDRRYLQCALDNLYFTLGSNPWGYCQQTGLGQKRNIEVVDNESSFDGIIEPVPGLPLGVGSEGFYWLNQYGKAVGKGTYPENWPLLNRWYDGFNVTTEFTMAPLIRETIVAGFFSRMKEGQNAPPRVKIRPSRLVGPAPFEVAFKAEVEDRDGRIRSYFWDFDDESFSIQEAPVHVFTHVGKQYSVCVTVMDDEGAIAYDEIRVASRPRDSRLPARPFEADRHTLALYHFDGDLRDASGNGLALKVNVGAPNKRPFGFETEPLWMPQPSGSCLRLRGREHFAVTIPTELLAKPATTALTVEMLLYLESFAGSGYPAGNSIVLGLHQEWDAWVGWKEDRWSRVHAPAFGGPRLTLIGDDRFAKEFPRDRWCHVRIVYDGRGRGRFEVDGRLFGQGAGRFFNPVRREPTTFSLGPFCGLVDEVRVSKVARK